MTFLTRITLVMAFMVHSVLIRVTESMDAVNSFIIGIGFWLIFFWWFDANYQIKKEEPKNDN